MPAKAKGLEKKRLLESKREADVLSETAKSTLAAKVKFTEENEIRDTQRSLAIGQDPRFKEIERYKTDGATHFNRILGRELLDESVVAAADGRSSVMSARRPASRSSIAQTRFYPESWEMSPEPVAKRSGLTPPLSRLSTVRGLSQHLNDEDVLVREIDAAALAESECEGFERLKEKQFEGRTGWEESFRTNMSRLMIDFRLTGDPSCRLNHLDRFHGWFTKEGKKQVRKEIPAPRFLTVDRREEVLPPGSARGAGSGLHFNDTTLNLAAAMKIGGTKVWSPHVERQLGVVPPPPPGPGYK